MLFAPAQDSIRGELGAVIGDDHPRLAAPLDDCDELAGNPSARDRGVGNRCQAFSRHVIDDVENTEAPAAGELIVDKVRATSAHLAWPRPEWAPGCPPPCGDFCVCARPVPPRDRAGRCG